MMSTIMRAELDNAIVSFQILYSFNYKLAYSVWRKTLKECMRMTQDEFYMKEAVNEARKAEEKAKCRLVLYSFWMGKLSPAPII